MSSYFGKFVGTLLLCTWGTFAIAAVPFDMLKTMREGSCQTREEITTNHKGKETAINIITVFVPETTVFNGKPHTWIEAHNQLYKRTRKGELKKKGKLAAMRTLVEDEAMSNFDNPMQNVRKYAVDMVVKTDEEAIRMTGAGPFAEMVMKAFGVEVDFQFVDTGKVETITTPAGTFQARRFEGTGRTTIGLFRKKELLSEVVSHLDGTVDFGVVHQVTKSTMGDKTTTLVSTLLSKGGDCPESLIDMDKVKDMPNFGLSRPAAGGG